MILAWLLIILLAGGLLAWIFERWNSSLSRWTALLALSLDLIIVLVIWVFYAGQLQLAENQQWLFEFNKSWIPQLGIHFHLALDGLSLILVALTLVLGIISVLVSWTEIKHQTGFFHFNMMWLLAGIAGVFLAMDLFLFYFFWELMLIPMYFIIAIWGHENRIYASIKFFLFTQLSGLFMLASILGIYFIHGQQTGQYTFNYEELLNTTVAASTAKWLMWGFLIAFLVKLPAVPVHTWLPDAHTEAPTAGSVILAGLLLKTGAYGLIRFVVPFFPEAAMELAPVVMFIGAVGIIYGAVLAFAQTDLKRLAAYTSVSHMGFVLLGVFAFNQLALQGTVMQMVCHGISTGTLFMLVGILQERIHTRDMSQMGGLWSVAPQMGAVAMIFAMASLGLPGLGNFVGEFLVLAGAYQANIPMTVLATVGLIFATIYALWIIQQAFHGQNTKEWQFNDLNAREWIIMATMIILIVWLGIYPQPVFDTVDAAIKPLISHSTETMFDNEMAIKITDIQLMIEGGHE